MSSQRDAKMWHRKRSLLDNLYTGMWIIVLSRNVRFKCLKIRFQAKNSIIVYNCIINVFCIAHGLSVPLFCTTPPTTPTNGATIATATATAPTPTPASTTPSTPSTPTTT